MVGEIPNFTSISDPYEPPLRPELAIVTHPVTLGPSVGRVLEKLKELRYT
jgi:adenylylsulfate kinase